MKDEDRNLVQDPSSTYTGNSYTYADYLKFEFEEMVELIRGKVFKMTPAPTSNHQKISLRLIKQILPLVEKTDCQLFHAPFDVILPINNKSRELAHTVVQPDLCIICDKNKIEEAGCFGAPDLIIEILSPSTSKKDLQDKYNVYEEAKVKEYWTVHPFEKIVVVYLLVNEKYEKVNVVDENDLLKCFSFPELKIVMADLFSN